MRLLQASVRLPLARQPERGAAAVPLLRHVIRFGALPISRLDSQSVRRSGPTLRMDSRSGCVCQVNGDTLHAPRFSVSSATTMLVSDSRPRSDTFDCIFPTDMRSLVPHADAVEVRQVAATHVRVRARRSEVAAMLGYLQANRTGVQAPKDAPSADDWLEAYLRRWREALILDDDQMRRILNLEKHDQERRPGSVRPGLLEAFVYLGLVVACVGVIVLTAQHWDELRSWARIASLAAPALLTLALGAALRRAAQPELQRAVALAWLVGIALAAGAVGVAGVEVGWTGPNAELAAGIAATLVAVALWVLHREHPQVIALAGSLVLLADAYGNADATIYGMLLLGCGAVALVLTEAGLFTPRISTRAAAAAGLVWGPFLPGMPTRTPMRSGHNCFSS